MQKIKVKSKAKKKRKKEKLSKEFTIFFTEAYGNI